MVFESLSSCPQERYLQLPESSQIPEAYLLTNSSPLFSQLQNRLFISSYSTKILNISYLLPSDLILLNLI